MGWIFPFNEIEGIFGNNLHHISCNHNSSSAVKIFLNGEPSIEQTQKLANLFPDWIRVEIVLWLKPMQDKEITYETSLIYHREQN